MLFRSPVFHHMEGIITRSIVSAEITSIEPSQGALIRYKIWLSFKDLPGVQLRSPLLYLRTSFDHLLVLKTRRCAQPHFQHMYVDFQNSSTLLLFLGLMFPSSSSATHPNRSHPLSTVDNSALGNRKSFPSQALCGAGSLRQWRTEKAGCVLYFLREGGDGVSHRVLSCV